MSTPTSTVETTTDSLTVVPAGVVRSRIRLISRSGPAVVVSVVVVALFLLMTLISLFYTPADPNSVSFAGAGTGPTAGHLLGTDSLGRDILSRWMVGVRYPIIGSVLITILSVGIGAAMALVMAWKGGWVDSTLSRVLDIVFAFPGLLLALLAASVFGSGLLVGSMALAIGHTPYVVRVLRSSALHERSLPYVTALEVQGFGAWAINARHIARNVGPYIAGQATLTFAGGFVALASLSFIGLGVQPPTADWGTMLHDGQSDLLQGQYTQAVVVALSIVILTAAVNVLGERLIDREEAA